MSNRIGSDSVKLLLSVLLVFLSQRVLATIPLDGSFVAEKNCPLLVSIKKGTNPDGAFLVTGRSYPVIGKNKADASHYRVRAEGAAPLERWVGVNCGSLRGKPAADSTPPADGGPSESGVEEGSSKRGDARELDESAASGTAQDQPSPAGRFVLAASWQPAFCELSGHRPECRGDGARLVDAGELGFALHGLWPQPRDNVFCDVSGRHRDLAERGPWSRLPALELGGGTRARLGSVMPGIQSYLHRYQWTKHGSCYGTGPDSYYRHSAALMEKLNASAVRDLFVQRIGRHVGARDIRAAFDRAFGRGAGERVKVRCNDGMISELQIGLRGRVSESASLAELIRAARRGSPGCRGGLVDAPG